VVCIADEVDALQMIICIGKSTPSRKQLTPPPCLQLLLPPGYPEGVYSVMRSAGVICFLLFLFF